MKLNVTDAKPEGDGNLWDQVLWHPGLKRENNGGVKYAVSFLLFASIWRKRVGKIVIQKYALLIELK